MALYNKRHHISRFVAPLLNTRLIGFEFFTVITKLPEMAILASKGFTAKKLPPVGLDLMITESRNCHWFKSLNLNQLS